MPSLSVCTITDQDPRRVAVAMRPLRAVADEIVVALDHRVSDQHVAALERVADRVLRWEYEAPLEVNLGPVHARCGGDWVLRIDGDELPSAALIERLADRSWADGVTHAYVARHWLWPDPASQLAAHPWRPDFQLRLLRNDPAVVRFPRLEHELPAVAGAGRFLEEGVYHLDLLLADEAARRRKAAAYERRRPGLRTEDGRPQNLGFYVPESRSAVPATAPVPAVDRELVARVLADPAGEAERRTFALGRRAPTPGEVVSVASRRPGALGPDDAEVAILDGGPARWLAHAAATVTVAVTNRSRRIWDPNEATPVRVGGRLVAADGSPRIAELRADLPCRVEPGRRELVRLHVAPIPEPGTYRLRVGVVQEDVAWLAARAEVEVQVARWPRVVVSAGFSSHRHLGDDLIVRAGLDALQAGVPDAQLVLLADDPADATARFGATAVHGGGPIVHVPAVAPDRATALARVDALRADGEALAAGGEVEQPHHLPLLHLLRDADALVLLGAGWLTSTYWQAALLPKLAEVEAADALGVPVVFESGTVGPIEPADDPIVARLLGRCARVAVRDGEMSAGHAARLGVPPERLHRAADVATAAAAASAAERDAWLRANGVEGPYAVVSLRDHGDAGAHADSAGSDDVLVGALGALAEAGLPALVIPHVEVPGLLDDRARARALAERAPLRVDLPLPPDDLVVALVDAATITVGNRFHLALLSDARGVPAIFAATSDFDASRVGSFTGGNVDVVGDGDADHGAAAVRAALARGRRAPAERWDPAPLVGLVADSIARRGRADRA